MKEITCSKNKKWRFPMEGRMTAREEEMPRKKLRPFVLSILVLFVAAHTVFAARSLTIPAKTWGICFGNSPRFNGLRFNITDEGIDTINGVNITAWKANDKKVSGRVNGISLGVMPYAGELNGIQVGVGTGAAKTLRGINVGLIGAGSGDDMIGLNFGGIGVGAGENLMGINIGLVGAGAGENAAGISIGGLGFGAGENLTGIQLGGLGVGAGEKLAGITLAGLGAGAGERLVGLTVCGLGAGAPVIKGITIAGLGLGGKNITGLSLALGTIQIVEDGTYRGLAVSAFNYFKGTQKGVAVGIVNYAYRLKGLQIGLVNIVRDNPRGRTALPIVNFNF
jgi:hypothetical protein